MKRKLALVMVSVLSVGALAACGNTASPIAASQDASASGGSSAASETGTDASASGTEASGQSASADGKGVTIQFWNSFTGSDGDILRSIVDQYNKENTDGITVNMDIMPAETLSEKLAPAITTGTAPALLIQGNMDMALYAGEGNIEPMDDFFDATGTDKSDFTQSALDGLSMDGHQYMIPMQWFTQYLYYNKDLFKAAGIEKAPDTWDEMAEDAAKITNPDKKVYGAGFCVSGGVTWMDSMILSNGGKILSDDNTKSELNSDANLKTMQFIQKVANSGDTPKGATGADLDNLMMANQLGMVVNGPWMVNGLKENDINFGVAPIPQGTSGRVGIAEISAFSIPKGTPEDQKAAAYKFIAYWNTTATCKEWSMQNGFPPYLKSVAADSEVQANEYVKAFSAIIYYGVAFGTGVKSASSINADVMFPLVENVMAGNDPQTELKAASDKIDQMLAAK